MAGPPGADNPDYEWNGSRYVLNASAKRKRAKESRERSRQARADEGQPDRGGRIITDDSPRSHGPRGPAKVGRKPTSLRSLQRSFRRIGSKHSSRALIVELLAAFVIVTFAEFNEGGTPEFETYVAPFAVFLVLTIVAEFGPSASRAATAFGALVLLGLIIAKGDAITRTFGIATSARPATERTGRG